MGPKNGLHAAGYNSAESEPIWMKFGELWAKCWGLAMADFGRDPRSSGSLRGSRYFFGQVNNARFHRFPVGQFSRILHNNVDRCRDVNFPNAAKPRPTFWPRGKGQKVEAETLAEATVTRANAKSLASRPKFWCQGQVRPKRWACYVFHGKCLWL